MYPHGISGAIDSRVFGVVEKRRPAPFGQYAIRPGGCRLGDRQDKAAGSHSIGTLIGAIFVAVLINGLTMFNFPYYAQSFVQGLLLMVALLMSYTLGPNRS